MRLADKFIRMNRKRILIVDDSYVDRKALASKLTGCGYEVLQAEDGSEAVSIARRERPDLIILDIMFPPDVSHGGGVPWDGFLILGWLRRLEEAKDIPVVFITGKDPEKHRARALAAGAVSFFQKPFEVEALLKVVREQLEIR